MSFFLHRASSFLIIICNACFFGIRICCGRRSASWAFVSMLKGVMDIDTRQLGQVGSHLPMQKCRQYYSSERGSVVNYPKVTRCLLPSSKRLDGASRYIPRFCRYHPNLLAQTGPSSLVLIMFVPAIASQKVFTVPYHCSTTSLSRPAISHGHTEVTPSNSTTSKHKAMIMPQRSTSQKGS
jgi:hypothetical protein